MVTVHVPQQSGEIRVAVNGGAPTSYRVEGGRIAVEDAADALRLAALIDGATVTGLDLAQLEAGDVGEPGVAGALAGMAAADLVAYVEAHPTHAAAVLAAENARPQGPRSTVTAAAERAAGS